MRRVGATTTATWWRSMTMRPLTSRSRLCWPADRNRTDGLVNQQRQHPTMAQTPSPRPRPRPPPMPTQIRRLLHWPRHHRTPHHPLDRRPSRRADRAPHRSMLQMQPPRRPTTHRPGTQTMEPMNPRDIIATAIQPPRVNHGQLCPVVRRGAELHDCDCWIKGTTEAKADRAVTALRDAGYLP